MVHYAPPIAYVIEQVGTKGAIEIDLSPAAMTQFVPTRCAIVARL
jgi:hypothetical protein